MEAKYMIDRPIVEHDGLTLYRRTGHDFHIWTSSAKKWRPSASACDAFSGDYILADDISESEALKLIERYS